MLSKAFRLKLALGLVSVLAVSSLPGQQKAEMGFMVGTSTYLGDLNPDQMFYMPSPAIGLLHIYNFNKRFALRSQLMYTSIRSGARDYVGADFNRSVLDMNSRFEINFRPFKLVDRKRPVSPYLNGGLGIDYVMGAAGASPVQMVLPFGIGIKAGINRRMCLGIEFGGRKLFTDKLDNVQNRIYTTGNFSDRHFFMNNDWYTVAGFFVTYKIFDNPGDCPVYPE